MTNTKHFAVGFAALSPVVVVEVKGDLDSLTTAELANTLDEAITNYDRHVIVDGRQIGFVDSTGISALVGALRRLNRARRRLAVVHGSGPLGRALAVTGLDHTFETHHTLEEAVAALADAPPIGRS